MKNIITTRTKSFISISIIACVFFWSCSNKDDAAFDPSFKVSPLTIKSITPDNALAGAIITINGTNFSTSPAKNLITFSTITGVVGVAATASTSNSITATVPNTAVTGKITVTTNNEETPGIDFRVSYPAPTITSISPDRGAAGKIVVIKGTNFSPLLEENTVTINGVEATINEVTSTTITISVPADAPEGTDTIVVAVQEVSVIGPDFTVPPAITITIPIDADEGDVEEAADGRMTLGSSDLELGEFDTFGTPDLGLQKIGLRFNGVTIPVGATIASASVQFTCDATGANPTEMTIYGEDIGNPVAYDDVDPANNVSSRTLTNANTVWNIPEWVSVGDKLPAQKTVDISSIIQEIIDRGDWVSGNSLNIIMIPTGVSADVTSSSAGREAETYADDQPELIITYIE